MTSSPNTTQTRPRVSVVARSVEVQLGGHAATVASGPVVLSVTGHASRRIRVDGRDRRLSGGAAGLLALDYTRSTGFHRVEVDGHVFWFVTEDHKLRLDGITRMLSHLRSLGTGWTGQALFSDGSGYLDPHVVYGWFDANARALDPDQSNVTKRSDETQELLITCNRVRDLYVTEPNSRTAENCDVMGIAVDINVGDDIYTRRHTSDFKWRYSHDGLHLP